MQNFIFAWKSHTKFSLHTKKKMQNCTRTWPEHLTTVSSWMLKCNASAVVVAEKCEYHRICCDYLVAAACQDGSAWNERKKTTTFLSAGCKYGLKFVEKLCTHVQVLSVVAMVKNERQGCNTSFLLAATFIVLCWTLNLHWYVLLGSSKKITRRDHWITAFSQINRCYSSRCPSCLTKALR